ncbi:hypothetical protein EGI20_08245 [Aquitalea sp. S1-19]|nr:hypothetical protein [Aquitalea sp. S1-19]
MSKANGWTPERRAKQAELIRQWRPWEKSTGPTSEAGKANSSGNATRHGLYRHQARAERAQLTQLISLFTLQRKDG